MGTHLTVHAEGFRAGKTAESRIIAVKFRLNGDSGKHAMANTEVLA